MKFSAFAGVFYVQIKHVLGFEQTVGDNSNSGKKIVKLSLSYSLIAAATRSLIR